VFRRSKTKKAGFEILLVSSRDTGPLDHPQGLADGPRNASRRSRDGSLGRGRRQGPHLRDLRRALFLPQVDRRGAVAARRRRGLPIEVLRLDDDFPEAGQRKRKWLSPKKAARRVSEPELRHLLSAFDPAACASDGA
jgi:hypothetical protein